MSETQQPAKVTTESSQQVLKAVAGRLAKLETGELPIIRYVGPDGTSQQSISPTGERLGAPAGVASPGEAVVDPWLVLVSEDASTPNGPMSDGWMSDASTPVEAPSGESSPTTKVGFFARIAAWFHRSS